MADVEIRIEAFDDASGTIRRVREGLRGLTSTAGAFNTAVGAASGPANVFASALGNIFQIATGIVGAQVFNRIAAGIGDIAGRALEAAAQFQTLQIQLEGLVALQIADQFAANNMVSESFQVLTAWTDEQSASFSDLTLRSSELHSRMELLERKIVGQVEKFGDASAEVNLSRIQLERYRQELGEVDAELGGLSGAQNQLVTVSRQVEGRTLAMSDALRQAQEPARQLMQWIIDFAVQTPFTVQSLTELTRGFLAVGIGVEPTKRLTAALANLGAGLGLTQPMLDRVAQNIQQVSRASKITERDLREFANAGVPLSRVLDDMARQLGVTRAEAEEFAKSGAEGVQAFIDSIIGVAERDFPDALERLSNTWAVATSNIGDFIESVLGKEVLGPTLDRLSGFISSAVGGLLAFREEFGTIGRQIGAGFDVLAPRAGELAQAFERLVGAFLGLLGFNFADFDLQTFLIEATGAAADFLEDATAVVDWLTLSLPGAWETAKVIFADIVTALEPITTGVGQLADAFLEKGPVIEAAAGRIAGAAALAFQNMGPEIIANVGGALAGLAAIWETHGGTIITVASVIGAGVVTALVGAFTLVTGLIEAAIINIGGLMDGFSFLLQGRWDEAWRAFVGNSAVAFLEFLASFNTFTNSVLALVGVTRDEFTATWQGIWNNARIILLVSLINLIALIQSNLNRVKGIIVEQVNEWIFHFENSIKRFVYAGAQMLLGVALGMLSVLEQVLGTVVEIADRVVQAFSLPGGGGVPTSLPGGRAPTGQGGQHGLTNFVVPPGYDRDTFPIYVSSGETVNVAPQGRSEGDERRGAERDQAAPQAAPTIHLYGNITIQADSQSTLSGLLAELGSVA